MVSVGRVPNSGGLGLEEVGVATDDRGFIAVNDRMQTSVPGIYAIGDVVGGALLAHKAYQEAKVAAEVIAGEPAAFDSVGIPAVIYTDPEIAWVGLSEQEAARPGPRGGHRHLPVLGLGPGHVPRLHRRASSRRSPTPTRKQLLGVVAVGRGVSEFIGEATLALEMGAFLEDVASPSTPTRPCPKRCRRPSRPRSARRCTCLNTK